MVVEATVEVVAVDVEMDDIEVGIEVEVVEMQCGLCSPASPSSHSCNVVVVEITVDVVVVDVKESSGAE